MSAVRFAMVAERGVEVLQTARSVQAQEIGPLLRAREFDRARNLVAAKEAASKDIATFEALLFPPDEEGPIH